MRTYSNACIETYHDFMFWGFHRFRIFNRYITFMSKKGYIFFHHHFLSKTDITFHFVGKKKEKIDETKSLSVIVSRLFEVKLLLSSKEALVWEDHSFGYSSSSHHWRQIYRFSRNLPCLQQRKDGSGGGRKGWRPKDQMILFVYVCPTLPKGTFDLE